MSATDWIAQRRELIEAATEGPWSVTYGPRELPRIWSDAPKYESAEFIAKCSRVDDLPDAHLIADARTSLPRALDALEAVLAHHCPGEGSSLGYMPNGDYGAVEPYCAGCVASDEYAVAWPCSTVRAIESALRADS